MLQPPPERLSLEKGALEGEGKDRYLKALEKKLSKLEGANKRAITSKDIMQSLSEARDDHMHQLGNPSSPLPPHDHLHQSPQSSGVTLHSQGAGLAQNDPWHASTSPDHHSQCSQQISSQSVAKELESEIFVPLEVETSGCGFSKCISCLVCGCLRGRTDQGVRLRSLRGSSLSAEEEREYLMDCDELEQTWEGAT